MSRQNIFIGGGIGAGLIIAALLLVLLFKWGAPHAMTNDQIISETKKCEAASMKPEQIINGLNYDVVKVICSTKDK